MDAVWVYVRAASLSGLYRGKQSSFLLISNKSPEDKGFWILIPGVVSFSWDLKGKIEQSLGFLSTNENKNPFGFN